MGVKEKFKSVMNVYKQFRKNHHKFRNATVRYYNFWALQKSEDCWFTQFIEHRNINPNKKTINFFSVYGHPLTRFFTSSPKIFFTGENIFSESFTSHNQHNKSYLKGYDLALGFDYLDQENYLRLPLWILYIIPANADLDTIKNLIEKYNDTGFRLSENRKRFCANISRHDKNGIRKNIIELLNSVNDVTCAGSFLQNTDELQSQYNDNKIDFLKNFKFNICPENSNSDGYVTEKLFEAIVSGCIPIYWGSGNNPESNIINQDAVLFYDPKQPELLVKKIETLWQDEKAYEEFCSIKPFKEDAAEIIWKKLNLLEYKFKKII